MTDKSSVEMNPEQAFYDYMLSTLRMSSDYSRRLKEQTEKSNQFYLGFLSIIAGGTFALITTQSEINFSFIFTASALIGLFGIRQRLLSIDYSQEAIYERVRRAGLHRYFQQFNPKAFKEIWRGSVIRAT